MEEEPQSVGLPCQRPASHPKGKENKQLAWKELREILSKQEAVKKTVSPAIIFTHLADLFLEWCQREKEPRTYEWYQ